MRISVIGCGYLGAVHAAAMAQLGHDVVGIDVDGLKIESLDSGHATFFEPGLDELLQAGLNAGTLRFSTRFADAKGSQVHFVAVGTPQQKNSHSADLSYVHSAVASLLPYLRSGDLLVGKSTVPVGTAATIAETMAGSAPGASLAWNPEFLREGFAVEDTISPDRLVYGLPADDPEAARRVLDEVYVKAIREGTPVVVSDYATAELVKVAANAFLATKISFINAMAEIAEAAGADVTKLADAIGYDNRIGRRFLNAGIGFGGGCLPKDIRAFSARADELGRGESVSFLKEVDAINLRRRQRVVDLALDALDGSVDGKKITVLGLAFKPQSDDVRDSPALDIAVRLRGLGAFIVATDPQANKNAARLHPHLDYAETVEVALAGADLVILATEWPQFRELDPLKAASIVTNRVIIDGRNCLDFQLWRDAGWSYTGLGRP